MSNPGRLIVVSAPSGSGKDTVLSIFFKKAEGVRRSVSATTREPRVNETHGVDYFFIAREEFEQLISSGGVLEYAEYCGNYYGTPKKYVDEVLAQGQDVVLKIDVQGAVQIKRQHPDAIMVFLMPPSMEELERRLRRRGTDSEESIRYRLAAAREEIRHHVDYDYVIVNDNTEDAAEDLLTIVCAERMKMGYHQSFFAQFFA